MSWKYVLNMMDTDDIGYALIVTMKTHYRFFVCKDENVYFYANGRAYATGITMDDLF